MRSKIIIVYLFISLNKKCRNSIVVWHLFKTWWFRISQNRSSFYQQNDSNAKTERKQEVLKKIVKIPKVEKQDGGKRCIRTRTDVFC